MMVRGIQTQSLNSAEIWKTSEKHAAALYRESVYTGWDPFYSLEELSTCLCVLLVCATSIIYTASLLTNSSEQAISWVYA